MLVIRLLIGTITLAKFEYIGDWYEQSKNWFVVKITRRNVIGDRFKRLENLFLVEIIKSI